MRHMTPARFSLFPALFLVVAGSFSYPVSGQMITGTWHGRIGRQRVELKIVQKGDSLTGTSYYFESANNYRRYAIKGYFDGATNETVWWDDRLIEERSTRFSLSTPGKMPLLSRADFNCPGGGRMMLNGRAARVDDEEKPGGDLHLEKTGRTQFEDEWDFVIDNYTAGANDPDIIDSIGRLALSPPVAVVAPPPAPPRPVNKVPPPEPAPKKEPEPVVKKEKNVVTPPVIVAEPPRKPDITEKFTARTRTLVRDIPLAGDSIELRFYDNAEIDGDSISLFVNKTLLAEHVRLSANAWVIKLPVAGLTDNTEITMVAENLGSIPPNTAYMVALVNNERYDALLASSEGSSAMIRLVRPR